MSDKKLKTLPKEKFITIFESFFKGEDFSQKPDNFWDELFLIKLNSNFIINEFKNISSNEDLIKLKKNINYLCNKAIEYLKIEINPIRLHNIFHTLYLFTYSLSVNKQIKLNSIEALEFLIGIEDAELKFQSIFESIYNVLIGDEMSHYLKTISLKYLLAMATQAENVNDNLFLDYFMINHGLFEAIVQIVSDPETRTLYGKDVLLLLTILLQYQKYDSENPFIIKLSILDNEMALTGIAMIMSGVLAEFNRNYAESQKEHEGESSWWNSVGTMIGNMFIGDEEKRRLLTLDDSILIVFYETIHLNRNFISTLIHAATDCTQITSSFSDLSSAPESKIQDNTNNPDNMRLLNPLSLSSNKSMSQNSPNLTDSDLDLVENPPGNLMVIFLQACSAVLHQTKIESTNIYDTTKLFMLILQCISEDQYANSLFHDPNLAYSVFLYKAKLRHRKITTEKAPVSRPLACSILDLMIEFVQSHLMKNFPFELYLMSLGIIQRLMCYQKKYRIRLDFNWQNLWNSLINVIKFITSYETTLISKGHNIFLLYSKIIIILNIFITYGDAFLPNAETYDYLYYDIMRMRHIFDNLLSLLNRSVSSVDHKEYAVRVYNQMCNVKSIINHFTPRIDSWSVANHVPSLTEQQVLEIVRTNYDSLTLKLEDDLDQYERYQENPHETNFFINLTKRIINDARIQLSHVSKFDQFNGLALTNLPNF
ncbi:hypothetical protein BpHYR1_047164 [Brachionus plicatilis]|uniref:Armadillo-like helical domain-containing protein n=1 Tax=Brachionus plicatilis TaxID=10195 RepID=A0A3M7S1S0_BRAPC|nr:hypothetical protein BpHYR1_047164 [Brachionus plicatilis]